MKKFLAFFMTTAILLSSLAYMGWYYLIPKDYPIFILTYSNGYITVDDDYEIEGTSSDYNFRADTQGTLTLYIEPTRTDSKYYDLKTLYVNGVDVTDEVNEKTMTYTTTVTSKLSVVAYFVKGEAPSDDE
ncbi:MAG: hypothetical protein R3Y27_01465 [Clostridia bacterium]